MFKENIEETKRLPLERFEELVKIILMLSDEIGILIPINVKSIIKRVEEKLRQEIMQNEELSDDEKEWELCGCPNDSLELMLLSVLRDIIILKLQALDFKIETEYYVEKPYTKTELTKFKEIVEKLVNDIFGENSTENIAEILFNTWKRNTELQQEQKLSLKEIKEKFLDYDNEV